MAAKHHFRKMISTKKDPCSPPPHEGRRGLGRRGAQGPATLLQVDTRNPSLPGETCWQRKMSSERFPLESLSPARPPAANLDSLGDAFLRLTVTFELVIDHGSHGERPSVPTEESDPAATQVPEGPLHVVQGPEQVGLVTRDPVQLQVQEGDACKSSPAPRKPLLPFLSTFRT